MHNMSRTKRERKTCNDVKIRHYLAPSADGANQLRQSSTTRAISGHAGATNGGAPATPTPIRPRLNASPSSSGSYAARSTSMRLVSGLKLAAMLRDAELVHTCRNGAAAVAAFETVTRRDARVQMIASCGDADALANVAVVAVPVEA